MKSLFDLLFGWLSSRPSVSGTQTLSGNPGMISSETLSNGSFTQPGSPTVAAGGDETNVVDTTDGEDAGSDATEGSNDSGGGDSGGWDSGGGGWSM